MRLQFLFPVTGPQLQKGILVLGCAIMLSACNTTGDGTKTALLSASDVTDNGASSDANASLSAIDMNASTQGENIAMLDDPILPAIAPLPASREDAAPLLAFAGAQASASPGSLAANVAFETPSHAPDGLDELIEKYSVAYAVPERLVRRVVHRESRFNPAARNGPYLGLMQISHPTARGMGYDGSAKGLLDAETNLKYAVRYLAGAYMVADGNESQAVRLYARGYYYDAKRKGLLKETGLDGSFRNKPPVITEPASTVTDQSADAGTEAIAVQASYAPTAQ